jgi:hypothetical protein
MTNKRSQHKRKNPIKARKARAKAVAKGAREALRLQPERPSVTRRVAEAVRRVVKRLGADAVPGTIAELAPHKRAVSRERRKVRNARKRRRGWA